MADNYKLSYAAEEIDERLGSAVLHTEQTLTPQQQARARANIGLLEITLTTPLPANESVALSDEENAMLNAAAAENRPLCIHFTMGVEEDAMQFSAFANKLCLPPTTVYSSKLEFLGNTAVFAASTINGTTWSATFQG